MNVHLKQTELWYSPTLYGYITDTYKYMYIIHCIHVAYTYCCNITAACIVGEPCFPHALYLWNRSALSLLINAIIYLPQRWLHASSARRPTIRVVCLNPDRCRAVASQQNGARLQWIPWYGVDTRVVNWISDQWHALDTMQKGIRLNESQLLYLAGKARQESLLRGYLHKKSADTGKWQQRFFVLYQNLLFYFESDGCVRPSGVALLEGCYCERLVTATPTSAAKSTKDEKQVGLPVESADSWTLSQANRKYQLIFICIHYRLLESWCLSLACSLAVSGLDFSRGSAVVIHTHACIYMWMTLAISVQSNR